jgi:hypothetical protein
MPARRCYHTIVSAPGGPVHHYLLSLPERALRSLSALAGGLLRQVGDAALPAAVRRTHLYRSMVEAALRFLIEQVGQVEGVYPDEGKLAEDFLLRRTAGNGLELIGILTFRASPVWVLAALADVSGAGRHLIAEISASLKKDGLIPPGDTPSTMEEVLDSLEKAAGHAAERINTPPLDVAGLRRDWRDIRARFARVPAAMRPSVGNLERQWADLKETAAGQQRSVFELSSLLALSAVTELPSSISRLARATRVAARTTGAVAAEALLGHYTRTLADIREQGLRAWWTRQFRPYLKGAAAQFQPRRRSWTERFLARGR